jgi:hypothetical protein
VRQVRWKLALLALVSSGFPSGSLAASKPAPIPPARPPEVGRTQPAAPLPLRPPQPERPQPQSNAPPGDETPVSCLARLQALGVKAEAVSAPNEQGGSCGVTDPIRLKELHPSHGSGSPIRFPEEPVVDCRLAEPLAHWLSDIAQPLISARLSTAVTAVRTAGAYSCRNRNHALDGKLSAHALGLALDIGSFELQGGGSLSVVPGEDVTRNRVMAAIRTAACGWFTTILGPGSDAAHADHLHVDVQQHGSNERYRICQ